mmetsp:Transcript_6302/g.18623  ORF Transcript_6302/g.18623 Transcript_6302/m.18623 type:complete len:406 (+) Transcript_6302:318-1535(+)
MTPSPLSQLRDLEAELGDVSSVSWDPALGEPALGSPAEEVPEVRCGALRRGKWTQPECDYAAAVIEHFSSGRLPGLSGGESLRATLSELLGCAPMRITKKLSSTRAHGKQCFKKRGELAARERVALEAARARFLASLEPGLLPLPRFPAVGPALKRSRVADAADERTWFAKLHGSAWLEDPAGLEPGAKSWLDRGDRTPPLEPSVAAKTAPDGHATLVRVVGADRPGLLGDLSDIFSRRRLNVVKCRAETFASGICRDEFEVVAVRDGRPLTPGAREALQQAVYDCVTEQRALTTTLRVAAPDRPGLLQQIAASLDSLSLSVVGARVSTVDSADESSAVDTFDVVDSASGEPVLDPARLRAIEARLAQDLHGPCQLPSPPPVAAAPDVDDAMSAGSVDFSTVFDT